MPTSVSALIAMAAQQPTGFLPIRSIENETENETEIEVTFYPENAINRRVLIDDVVSKTATHPVQNHLPLYRNLNPTWHALHAKFNSLINKMNELPLQDNVHIEVRDELVEELTSVAKIFWANKKRSTFVTFKDQCIQALADAEQHFEHEPGLWANIFRPILRALIECIIQIGKYLNWVNSAYEPTLFKKQSTQAEKVWRTNHLALDLCGDNGLLSEIEQKVGGLA